MFFKDRFNIFCSWKFFIPLGCFIYNYIKLYTIIYNYIKNMFIYIILSQVIIMLLLYQCNYFFTEFYQNVCKLYKNIEN